MFFAKGPSPIEILNDLDNGVATFFRVLRDRPADLERACRLTPHARAEYAASDMDAAGIDDLERARRFWVRVNQSFAKSAGTQTGFSVTTGRTQSVPNNILSRIGRFEACSQRLMQATFECCDAAALIERMAKPESVVYVDPPYLAETRRGRDRQRPGDYLHDMGTEDEHRRLAQVLRSTAATVILSGYPSNLYDELYGDWWRLDVPVTVHSSNSCTNVRGARIERIWANRDLEHGRLALEAT